MQFNKDFCEKFDIKYPIFQAGMGKTMGTPTTPELVYEVSNAGGVGFLGASGLTLEEIENSVKEIKKILINHLVLVHYYLLILQLNRRVGMKLEISLNKNIPNTLLT